MLTVYSGENGYPISNDDYYVRLLASGLDEVVFQVSIRDDVYKYITEEARIRDRDQNYYIIKQIDAGNEKAKVVAQIDIDDWKAAMYKDYTNNSATVVNTVLSVLPSGWSCIDQSLVSIRRTIPTDSTLKNYNVTAWQVLQDCCNVYKVRFRFDNANKIVYIINPDNYTNLGAFATRDLNLKDLNYKGKSSDFCTRLYAEGADGLTFESINNGKPYVENFNYSQKIISAYWKDERYTDAQSLLDDATAKLNVACMPQRSYDCDVLDLANTNPEMYGFEDFSLFKVITLIDDAKQERLDYQIVEKWEYPYYPVNNKVVLSTETPKIQNQVISLIEAVNSPVSPFQRMLQSAIANSTALITGNHGGYVILHDSDGNGTPDEILIMDTDDIETAQNVWRWNKNGLGFSSTGYRGTYGTAITADGSIVASFITSGLMRGDRIEAGTLDASALSISAQEQLSQIHNYMPYDVLTNINRWEYNAKAPALVDGMLELDGTEITAYNPNYQVQIKSDYVGKPHISFNFKFRVDREITIPTQQFVYFYFLDSEDYINTKSWKINWATVPELSRQEPYTLYPNTEYHFTNEIQWNEDAVITETFKPRIGWRFLPKCKTYLYDFEVTSAQGDYVNNTLQFTADGLNSLVSRGDIISSINQTAEQVSIKASRIDLTGNLSLCGDFHSYKPNDNTTYAFLDSGNLSFYNNGANIFTVAATPLLGNKAGIFFGDANDPTSMARYVYLTQDRVTTPQLYVHSDDSMSAWLGGSGLVCEGEGVFKTLIVDRVQLNYWANHPTYIRAEVNFDGNNSRVTFDNGGVQFYSTVYNSSGGAVFVSDKRKKKSIKKLIAEKAKAFIMALKPSEFKFKDGTSGRKHHGFIAQEVNKAMYEDWGLYVEDTETDFIGLRYDEIIADLVAVVQDQEKRIEALERMVNNDKSDV